MDKYDILFLSPSRYYLSATNSYGHQCLSAYLYQESGITSRVYSGHINDTYRIIKREVEGGKTKIVGFYALQDTVTVVTHMSRYLRKQGIMVIVGGPQAAVLTEEEIRNDFDYVLVGEGEISLNRLMNYLIGIGKGNREGDTSAFLSVCDSLTSIRGLKYIDDKGVFRDNGPAECIQDLDMKSFFNVDWNLNPHFSQSNALLVMTGRGCPFSCAFCHEGTVRSVRLRSVENVLREIDCQRKYFPNLRVIEFGDDTFTLNIERVKAIGEGLRERGLVWICEAHVGMLYKHPEMIGIMVENGMISIQLGIESGDPEVLRAYGKHTTPEMIEKVVKDLYDAGVKKIDGNVILGGAFETRESMERSTEMALRLMEIAPLVIEVNSLFYAPYPLTPMTTNPDRFDMEIVPKPFNYILNSMHCCVNSTKSLTRGEIQEGLAKHDERVAQKYKELLSRLTFTQYWNYIKDFPNYEMPNTMWKYHIKQIENVWLFCKNAFRYNNLFDEDAVPERTFQDLRYEGEALKAGGYLVTGNERRMLELASGAFTFRELEAEMGLSRKEICEIYASLHEKLLVYMNRF